MLGAVPIYSWMHRVEASYLVARIYKEGLTERATILCKLNKSLLESSTSVGIHTLESGINVHP